MGQSADCLACFCETFEDDRHGPTQRCRQDVPYAVRPSHNGSLWVMMLPAAGEQQEAGQVEVLQNLYIVYPIWAPHAGCVEPAWKRLTWGAGLQSVRQMLSAVYADKP